MPSLTRLSPSVIVTIRRGALRRRAIALAASGSVGETIAPRTKATAQGMPSIIVWATTATVTMVASTSPMASVEIVRRSRRRSRSDEKKAAE